MALSRGLAGFSTHLEPRVNMIVTYIDNNLSTRIKNGMLMGEEMFLFDPTVVVEGGGEDDLFTLITTIRDAGHRHSSPCLIWFVSDIRAGTTGEDTRREDLSYESPSPEGFFMYEFSLFKQMGRQPILSTEELSSRDNFITRRFAAAHNLGAPVASLYFYTVISPMDEVVGDHAINYDDERLEVLVSYNGILLVPNGIFLTVHEVRSQPMVDILIKGRDHRASDLFTLVMIDRVGLSPNQDGTEFLHWLVTDIPAGRPISQHRKTKMNYTSPNPGRWVNTYMFVFFKQTRWLQETITPALPHEFSTRKFAADNNLGNPAAAVWFNVG